MKILRNDLVVIWLFIVFLSVGILAQRTADNETLLTRFERSIDRRMFAEIERDLIDYVISNPADARGFSLLAKLRLKQDRPGEARSLANKALTLAPGLFQAKITLAQCALRLRDNDNLRKVLSSISENESADSRIRLELVELYIAAGDCPAAINLIAGLPVKLRNADALPFRAKCILQVGDKKEITALLPLAVIQARQGPAIAVAFAELLFSSGLNRETANLLKRVLAASPNNFEALLLLAKVEIVLKSLVSARVRLSKAEKIRPDSAELFFTRSTLETVEGKHQEAYESLEKALALNSNNVGTLAQYVIAALRVGQAARAVKAAEKLLTIDPENVDYFYLLGIATLQTDNLRKAEEALLRYAGARPQDSRGCLALGLAYIAQNDKSEAARQQMQKCIALDPGNHEAAFQLGLSFKAEGDTPKAVEYFEQVIKLSPDHAAALRELGGLYLQTGVEAKARQLLEKAVLLNPNDADTHFQLSRLYNVIGDRDLGKKHLEIFQKLRNLRKDGM